MFAVSDLHDAFPDHIVHQPELGSGGYKSAYLATRNGQDVVLKITRNEVPRAWDRADGVGAEGRVAQELRILADVESPRVVSIIDGPHMVKIDGRPHLYYEETYLPGGTLADAVRTGPISREGVIAIGLDVLDGITALWDQLKVVHRDIKPSNIGFDHDGRAVLFDLGTAYDPEVTDQTDTGDIAPKTSMYAAPEQFQPREGVQPDFRTDFFALGISLLESRLGRHPFVTASTTMNAYFAAVQAVRLSDLVSMGVEDSLARALLRCVQFNVSRRHKTIESLRVDLENAS
jgi:serine/threonine protein kinase